MRPPPSAVTRHARPAELVRLAETALGDCPWYRIGHRIVKTTGVAARFDAAAEITLNELRVELSYPLDRATDDFFRLEMG